MKIHYNIKQGSDEWHRLRYAKIGGTRSKGLFVKSDTLKIELLAEMTEDYYDEDGFQSAEMMRGQDLEPLAIEQLEQFTGVKFNRVGWIDSDIPNVGISPDGIDETETICCEVKCPSKKRHMETILEDAIPLDNLHQCVHYFTVNPKLTTLYFGSFRPENKLKPLFVKKLTRDSEVNLGTKARPVIKTVKEWVEIATIEATKLNQQLTADIERLKF
jgi:hypothetical protein